MLDLTKTSDTELVLLWHCLNLSGIQLKGTLPEAVRGEGLVSQLHDLHSYELWSAVDAEVERRRINTYTCTKEVLVIHTESLLEEEGDE